MPLSTDQQCAVDEISRSMDGNEQFHILTGSTGTGKTFVVQYLIKTLDLLPIRDGKE